jgi:hypothetical protein
MLKNFLFSAWCKTHWVHLMKDFQALFPKELSTHQPVDSQLLEPLVDTVDR